MSEIESALLVFVLVLAATAVGVVLRPRLPEEHKADETVQLVQLVIGMLVTFAALVLGLLTAAAKDSFDTVAADFRQHAAQLIQLDAQLRDYGPDADSARRQLRDYTAAIVASTWREKGGQSENDGHNELPGQQLEDARLGQTLRAAGREIRRLEPRDAYHRKLADEALASLIQLDHERWKLIEEARNSISKPFFAMLTFWLMAIFLSFGLIAPRNALALVTITLGALSIASAVYVIVDLETPLSGSFSISGEPMRDALAHLSR